jgi:hypothetical protein
VRWLLVRPAHARVAVEQSLVRTSSSSQPPRIGQDDLAIELDDLVSLARLA